MCSTRFRQNDGSYENPMMKNSFSQKPQESLSRGKECLSNSEDNRISNWDVQKLGIQEPATYELKENQINYANNRNYNCCQR